MQSCPKILSNKHTPELSVFKRCYSDGQARDMQLYSDIDTARISYVSNKTILGISTWEALSWLALEQLLHHDLPGVAGEYVMTTAQPAYPQYPKIVYLQQHYELGEE